MVTDSRGPRLPDPGPRPCGSPQGTTVYGSVTLPPGQVHTERWLLNQWAQFAAPGRYHVRAERRLALLQPDPQAESSRRNLRPSRWPLMNSACWLYVLLARRLRRPSNPISPPSKTPRTPTLLRRWWCSRPCPSLSSSISWSRWRTPGSRTVGTGATLLTAWRAWTRLLPGGRS